MTNLPHIISLHRAGAASPASDNGASAESGDPLGFLSQLLQSTGETGDASATGDTLSAKLSAALKGLSPADLKAKLADLLNGKAGQTADAAAPAADGTQETLLNTLIAKLDAQMQAQQPTPGSPIAKQLAAVLTDGKTVSADKGPSLAEMLNAIEPGSGDNSKIQQALDVQTPAAVAPAADAKTDAATAEAPLDPAILDMLKDKVATLQMTSDTADKGALQQVKEDMVKALKDQGLDQSSIDRYLGALASFLQGSPASQTAGTAPASATPATSETDATDSNMLLFVPTASPAVAKSVSTPKQAAAAPGSKKADAAGTQQMPDDGKPSLGGKADAAQNPAAQASGAKAAQAPVTGAKVAGPHINTLMVSALAGADAGTSLTDPSAQPLISAALPNTEAAAGQTVTNYMSSMKGVAPSTVTQMVTMQLQQNMENRVSSMTLQLHPSELGQMDIKLKFEKDGQVRAHMTVDKPETLSMLQKDSAFLEKTLQQNGVKIDERSITFDLRQQGRQNMGGNDNQGGANREQFAGRDGAAGGNLLQASIAVQAQGYITQSGVNIMV